MRQFHKETLPYGISLGQLTKGTITREQLLSSFLRKQCQKYPWDSFLKRILENITWQLPKGTVPVEYPWDSCVKGQFREDYLWDSFPERTVSSA